MKQISQKEYAKAITVIAEVLAEQFTGGPLSTCIKERREKYISVAEAILLKQLQDGN